MNLDARRKIEVELPEFLIRSLLYRVAESNAGAAPHERVDLDDVVEWYVAAPITVRDLPELESAIPGFGEALSAWLNTASYEPQ
jgi:hypothetical protein